ncbi:ABC transporter [Vibrio sp. JCM 19236]|nr:ABC transporter [Vibrio sp. JCM 19236]
MPKGLSTQGEISIFGKVVNSQSEVEALWGKELAMLPQEPWLSLDPIMPSQKQVSLVKRLVGLFGKPKSESIARDSLKSFGLEGSEQKVPSQLSGGMAQRLAYLCATAAGGKVLIADEPTKGLDASRKHQLIRLLKDHSRMGHS